MGGLRLRYLLLALAAGFCTAGCAGIPRDPVAVEFVEKASVLDGAEVRYWGDRAPPNINALTAEKWAQVKANRPELLKQGRPQISFLAVSGGGSDGAFGAGLLVGWTARGDRPEFDIVTGVSTGALTAPFAFLGPKYDPALKAVYTTYSTDQLVTKHPVRGLLGGEALASNAPLAGVIASYINEGFMAEVAREHARGRRLLIGTTNLDAQRPVIWDMGRIASSNNPRALALFRNVLLASAAIPGLFPPVYIEVEAEGQMRQEMHVDGGTTNQVFLLPTQIKTGRTSSSLGINPVRRLYIIRNGRIDPEFKVVKANTLAIAGRSISTLIKTQGIGDLYQMYEFARQNRVGYNLAYIPGDFPDTSTEAFDPLYMSRLFDLGAKLGQSGRVWTKTPPRLDSPS
ncbi:MAG: patatin-like phospholipase family protein [Methyloceanibacter sp.]